MDSILNRRCEPGVLAMHRIYVASSWRNDIQPNIVRILRKIGHMVYDFRNPAPGQHGFAWSEIDPEWEGWCPEKYREMLLHPRAIEGFNFDKAALDWATAGVIVLPCGRSAHLEAGYLAGQGKRVAVVMLQHQEPDLMYLLGNKICVSIDDLKRWAVECLPPRAEDAHDKDGTYLMPVRA